MTATNPHIYTAGAITWANEQYTGWRSHIDTALSDVTFFHPTETYNEYEQHRRAGCVTEDINMIEQSDGIIAFITKPEQIGTVTEVVHGVKSGKPVLLLIAPSQWDYSKDHNLPFEITPPLDYHSSEYWFLVNYLLGDKNVDLPGGDVISGWKGYDRSGVWIITQHSIPDIASEWVRTEIID